ncbi:MAG: dephospho-CoA kinase [Thermoanaerobaculales bacterium]
MMSSHVSPDLEARAVCGRSHPCLAGLTGGLASGKSTVARMLAARGASVFDADAGVHDLYRPGKAGARVVAELFGDQVLDAEGGVDRRALGHLVLQDADARLRLETEIHPLVRAMVAAWRESLGPVQVAVVEAALLVETGAWRNYDVLIVVWCEPNQQLDRAQARGMPLERARRLLAAQLPFEEKKRHAHVVVDNRGSLEDLGAEIDCAWSEIRAHCADRR